MLTEPDTRAKSPGGAALGLADPDLLREAACIGGDWVEATAGAAIAVTSPADGRLIAHVPDLPRGQVEAAIAAAEAALPGWRAKTARERATLLRRWFDLCMAAQADLARLLTLEQGKPLSEAMGEIAYGSAFLEWFAEEARRTYGDVIPSNRPGQQLVVTKEPVGVVAAITPWNFPNAMITRKAGAALAAGCTVIVKPASATPLSALALVRLAERAGIPAGVLNVVTGSARMIGEVLTRSPVVRKISFTGSTEVGRVLLEQAASTIKKCSMELGGNAPFLIFDDADLDRAVDGVIASKFRNAGQTCVCANRIYVHDAIYEAFTARLIAAIREMPVGDGLAPDVAFGPLIDAAAVAKVEEHVADALARGGRVALGGRRHALGGNFYEPTVITDIAPGSQLLVEETFGPVAPLIRFTDEAEVIARANDTEFGLASYLYTRDLARAWRVSAALEYGMVGINEGLLSTEVAPFGGIKQSGLGREGSHYGIEDYLETKYLCMGGLA
ncbi:NAD-dependent succinate-semialdehyde dehydrogenase [Novosphingobium resinovorum]|uniref:NAD-dependent succinate-semialdehyde dehydrogenase n=1 Tax=Novosphingobium resinovorum TaxID=158500 RepID=UPI002ED325E5|nr:NAD-dependent succinate-semialdehyde dehydrogenase [Novosphingobium resinovorum]